MVGPGRQKVFKVCWAAAVFFLLQSSPALGRIDFSGKLAAELVYDDLLTASAGDTLVETVNFNPNLKIRTDQLAGFLDLSGDCVFTEDALSAERTALTFTVNKAYVAYESPRWSMVLGKNRFLKGVGYGWNPSDITNPQKSPLYQDERKRGNEEGVEMASVSYFGWAGRFFYEVTLALLPAFSINQAKKVIYTKFNYGSWEGFLVGGFQDQRPPLYGGYFRTAVPYADFLSLYGEFQSTELRRNNKFLFGLQFNPALQFTGNLQLQAEFFYHPDGGEDLDDYLQQHPGLTPVLGETLRHYYYLAALYYDLSSRFSLGVMKNADQDQSGIVSFLYSRFIGQEAMLNLGGYYVMTADARREFARLTQRNFQVYTGLSIYF